MSQEENLDQEVGVVLDGITLNSDDEDEEFITPQQVNKIITSPFFNV